MARTRLEGSSNALTSYDEVDQVLKEIAQLNRELALIETSQNEQIDAIKNQSKLDALPFSKQKAEKELLIKEFCEANRADFMKVKTRSSTFGSVGFRLSSKVVIKRMADTLTALKALGLTNYIRVKETPNKEKMQKLNETQLAEVGASLKKDNTFWYEVKEEPVKVAA